MISVCKVRYQVLGITSNEYKDKETQAVRTFYQAQVFNPDSQEAGSIGISENLAQSIKPDPAKVVVFNAEFNDKFGKLNLKSVSNEK